MTCYQPDNSLTTTRVTSPSDRQSHVYEGSDGFCPKMLIGYATLGPIQPYRFLGSPRIHPFVDAHSPLLVSSLVA